MNVIEQFYTAFAAKDSAAMNACYSDDIIFHDPAFGELRAERAKEMWNMLCDSQKDQEFIVKHKNVHLNEDEAEAEWEAFYTFSKTGNKVHNQITAKFKLNAGKIIEHRDDFDVQVWAKQALGFKGRLLGGTKFFKHKLQQQTNQLLDKYIAKQKG